MSALVSQKGSWSLPGPMDAAAVNGCLSEVKAAIAGLEAATLASLRSSDLRLNEAQTFASSLLHDACHAAEEQTHANKRRLEEAEARILRLEDKLMSKRSEIAALRDLAVKMKEKLAQKSEALLAIGETDCSKRPETVKPDPASAIVPINGRDREISISPGTREKNGQERRKEAGGDGNAHSGRRRGSAREYGRESSPDEEPGGGRNDGPDDMSHSEDSSPAEPRESRRKATHTKDRGRPHSRSRRSRAGREQSSRSPEGGGRRHAHSRDRRSHDSNGRRVTDRGSADLREVDRGESSSRSRSRRPWHSSSRGSKGKGKGKEAALCIPFVFGKCVWGDRCRERHPDAEDARLAKESLQSKVCRFGVDCKRKDCVFRHPQGRKRDEDES